MELTFRSLIDSLAVEMENLDEAGVVGATALFSSIGAMAKLARLTLGATNVPTLATDP